MAVRKTEKGAALKRWFKEDWKDVKTGKACGRKKGDNRGTPYCRKKKVAEKKKLGQPAGKPRRVKPVSRKKK